MAGVLNPRFLKAILLLMGLGLAAYIVAPPLYWHLAETLECTKRDPEVSEDMEKNFTDLLAEELKLREAEAAESHRRADVALLEAKKAASQYQKEADKCNSGMDTCEEARERAEAVLAEQKKLSAMWEMRAQQQGWKPTNARPQSS